jgi:hypothetical protein
MYNVGLCQGDQIGRIFAYWAIVKFKLFYVKYKSSSNFGRTFFHRKKCCIYFDKKTGWATFWAIFSQTHLVNLVFVFLLGQLSLPFV